MVMRTAILAFLSGAVVTGVTGYFYIHRDIYLANGAINVSIEALKEEVTKRKHGQQLSKPGKKD